MQKDWNQDKGNLMKLLESEGEEKLAASSNGQGHSTFNGKITGSNPVVAA